MHILCITHADFETPGVIHHWVREHGHTMDIVQPYQGDACPESFESDMLILMGGPQSPLAIDEAPYLKDEITCIQRAIAADKIVLGFCLGAQLIGEALGATTERSPVKEVGVYPIHLTEAGTCDPVFEGLPSSFPVIHWHNDMPGETSESTLLAYSDGCPRQVLRYGPKWYGLQCHLEITSQGINELIDACPESLAPSTFTQNIDALRANNYPAIHQTMFTILDRLAALQS